MNNIPKIWLSYNRILIESYNQEFSREDYLHFLKDKKVHEIHQFIEKYGNSLLKNIARLSGIPWFRKEIPIYLVPNKNLKSFSHPLVLSLKSRDLKVELLVLAHEFSHVNLIADRDSFFMKKPKTKRMNVDDEVFCWVVGKLALQKTIKNWRQYKKAWNEILSWRGMGKTTQEIKRLENAWDYNKINFVAYYKNFTQKDNNLHKLG